MHATHSVRMDQNTFTTYLHQARLLADRDYGIGYERGLLRHFHGEALCTEPDHAIWSRLVLDGDIRAELGEGFRDGLAGKPPLLDEATTE